MINVLEEVASELPHCPVMKDQLQEELLHGLARNILRVWRQFL